jgi:hypothetical protein
LPTNSAGCAGSAIQVNDRPSVRRCTMTRRRFSAGASPSRQPF